MTKTKMFNHIRNMRRNRGLIQKQLAVLLGHRYTDRISRYENGVSLPTLEAAFALEIVLGIKLQDLYPGLYKEVQVLVLQRAKTLPWPLQRSIRGRLLGKDRFVDIRPG